MTDEVSGSIALFERYNGRVWSVTTGEHVAAAAESRRRREVAELHGVLDRHGTAASDVGASLLCHAAHPGESATEGAALERRLASATALETLAENSDTLPSEQLAVVLDILDAAVHRPRGSAWRMSDKHETHLSVIGSLCRVVDACVVDDPQVVASYVDVFVDVLSLDAPVHSDGVRVLWSLADVDPDALDDALDALVRYLERGGWEVTSVALVVADVAETYPERVSDAVPHLVRVMRQEAEPFSIVATQVTGDAQFGSFSSPDRRPQTVLATAIVTVANHDPTELVDHLDVLVSLIEDSTGMEQSMCARAVALVAGKTPEAFDQRHVDTLEGELQGRMRPGVGVVMALAALLRADEGPTVVDPNATEALRSRLDAEREDWTFWALLVLREYVDAAPSLAETVADATAPLVRTASEREQRVAIEVLLRCANAAPEDLRGHVANVRYVAVNGPEETAAVAVSVLRATLESADNTSDALTSRVLEALVAVSHERPEIVASCKPVLAEYATRPQSSVSESAMHALAHTVEASPDAVSANTASAIKDVVVDRSGETQLWGCRALVSLVAARPSLTHVSPDTISRLCSSSDPFQQFSGAQLAYETDRLDLLAGANTQVCDAIGALLSADDDMVRKQAERMLAVDEPFFDREAAFELLESTPAISRVASQLVEILALNSLAHLGVSAGVDALSEFVTDTLEADSDDDGADLSEEQTAAIRNAAYVLTTLEHRPGVSVTAEDAYAALRETDRPDLKGLGALGALSRSRSGLPHGQALCQQFSVLLDFSAETVREYTVAALEALQAGRGEASIIESELPDLTSALPAEDRYIALRLLVQLCRHLSASDLRHVRSAIEPILLEVSDALGTRRDDIHVLSLELLGFALDPSMDAPPDDLVDSMQTVLSSGKADAQVELLQTMAVAARIVPSVVEPVDDAIAALDHPGSRAVATEVLAVVARATGRIPVHPLWVNQFVYNGHIDNRYAAALVNARSPEPDHQMDVSNLLENMTGGADGEVATLGLSRGAASATAVSSAVAQRRETFKLALDGPPDEAHQKHVVRLLNSPHAVVRVRTYRVLKAVVEAESVSHVVDAIDTLAEADPRSPPKDGYVTTFFSYMHATDALAGLAGVVAKDLFRIDEVTHGSENPAALVFTALLDAHPTAAMDAIELDSLAPAQFLELLDVLQGMDPDPEKARRMIQAVVDHHSQDGRANNEPNLGSPTISETALAAVLEAHLVAATKDEADGAVETSDWGRHLEQYVESLLEVLESPGESQYVRSAAMEQWLPVPLLPAVQAVSTVASIAPDHARQAAPTLIELLDHHADIVEFMSTGTLRSLASHDASKTVDVAPDITDALATRITASNDAQTANLAAHALADLVEADDQKQIAETAVGAIGTHFDTGPVRVLPGVAHCVGSLQRATDVDMTVLVDPVVDRLLESAAGAERDSARSAFGGGQPDGPSDELVAAFQSLARQEASTVADAVSSDDRHLPTMQSRNSMAALMNALGALGAHSPSVLEELDAINRFKRGAEANDEVVTQKAAYAVHEIVRAHPSVAPSFIDYFEFVLESGSPFEHFEALATLYELVAQDAPHLFESLDALRPIIERQLVAEYPGSRYAAVRLLQEGYARVDALSVTSDAVDRYLSVFEAGHSRTGIDEHSMLSVPESPNIPLQYALLGVRSYDWPEVDLNPLLPDGMKYAEDTTLKRSPETMIHVHLYVLTAVADVFTTALECSTASVEPHVDRLLALADDAIYQHRQLLGSRLLAAVADTAPDALAGHEESLHALLGRVPDSPLSGVVRCTLVDAFTNLPAATATDTAYKWRD